VFIGYKDAAHDRGLWLDTGDGRRWLNTGDLGRQDADGYFYLTGRRKELIIRGGHNIDPASIEQPLHEHPAVQIAAAVGRPDAHAGEVPVAYVQLKPGSGATEAELMAFVKGRIAERAAAPKAIRIIEAMPLTGVGKIFKPTLKLQETEAALADALRAAGVAFATVKAASDPAHGTVIDVHLAEGADRALAEAVLGQFPFRFRLGVGDAPDR
jgi:fatty-acyl-CoA synthase